MLQTSISGFLNLPAVRVFEPVFKFKSKILDFFDFTFADWLMQIGNSSDIKLIVCYLHKEV